jgi:uncharacterized membrane protein YhaH (DUF805 family)
MLEAFFLLSGRLGRLAYFGYSLVFGVVLVVIALVLILPTRNSPNGPMVLIVVGIILGLIALWGGIALSVKRLHDLDMSGWHYAWMVVLPGILNAIGNLGHMLAVSIVALVFSLAVWIYLQFWPGTDGMNRYGYRP